MSISRLQEHEQYQLTAYARALEQQDDLSDIQFQATYGVSKNTAKNNIAKCIRDFVANRTGKEAS